MGKKLNWAHLILTTIASLVVGYLIKLHDQSDWWTYAGFVSGVVGVYLAAVENIFNWPIGIVNILLYAWVFYTTKLYADTSLQIFYFILAIHGWWMWAYGGKKLDTLPITRLKPRSWFVIAAIWVGGTAIYTPIIVHFKGSAPFADSTLTVASIITQVLLNTKKLENWILWIVIDALYIPLYLSKHLESVALLYFIFLILAVIGLRDWRKHLGAKEDCV